VGRRFDSGGGLLGQDRSAELVGDRVHQDLVKQLGERDLDGDAQLAVGVLVGPGAAVLLAQHDLEPVVLHPA
jgi:hypothetical protein